LAGCSKRAAADADVEHAQGQAHVGNAGMAERRRRRRALDRAHAEGVAALEAEHLARQARLQHAGLVALDQHQVADVELHLDAVQVGDRGAFVGLDDVVHLRAPSCRP
jgi:hypothetical protein